MKQSLSLVTWGWVALAAAAQAQERFPVEASDDRMLKRRNRISLKGTFNFGIKTDFTTTTPNNAGPATLGVGGLNRTYDDGYVRVDINGNAGGLTWNWGNNVPGQYLAADPAIGGAPSLTFHTATSLAEGATRGSRDRMQAGVELAYEEVLGRFHLSERRRVNVGIIASIGYLPLKQRDAASLAGTVSVRTDKFDATGVPPPGLGGVVNSGQFDVPGPLLLDPLGATGTAPAAATGTVDNRLDGSLYSFNLGPFVEVPLHDRVSLTLGGGLGFVYADTGYTFRETVVVPGVVTATRSGRVARSEWLFSGIVRANLYVALSEAWSWELGFAYQYAESYRSSVAGKTAHLQLDGIISLNTGLNYAF